MSVSSGENKNQIVALFKIMESSEVKISQSRLAELWLKEHDYYIASFVDGKWGKAPSNEPNNFKHSFKDFSVEYKNATPEDLDLAITSCWQGNALWNELEKVKKTDILYKISQCLEQQNKLVDGIENFSKYGRMRGKNYVRYLIDSFKYYSSLISDEDLHKEFYNKHGLACVFSDDDAPISSLWLVSSLLASGSSILYLVDSPTNLSSFLLAEICHACGVPAGAFNVVYCQSSLLTEQTIFKRISKFILSPSKVKILPPESSLRCIPCEILPCKWPNVIIYDSADLDAAINCIFEITQINEEEPWPLNKLYLQEAILKDFVHLIARKISCIFDGNLNNMLSFYIMGSEVLTDQLKEYLEDDSKKMFNIAKLTVKENKELVPAIIFNKDIISEQNQKEAERTGPGIFIEVFRTVKESIAMFNSDKKGPDVSLWTEEMHLALEATNKLKTKTVWINSINLYDPSVASGTLYLNGSSVFGGIEGLFCHLSLSDPLFKHCKNFLSYGTETLETKKILIENIGKKMTKTYKLFIGGAFVNSNDDTFHTVVLSDSKPYAVAASANVLDVDKAVACACSSQTKWENYTKFSRSAIFRKASEIVQKRKEEFVTNLCLANACKNQSCSCNQEVESAISLLTYWSNYIIHFEDGTVETRPNFTIVQKCCPFGVIGIQCNDYSPLCSFVFLVSPALIFGNSVIAIAPRACFPSTLMCEVFQSAGLPGGVLNVLTNPNPDYLTRHLTSHLSIDAFWFTEEENTFIYYSYHSTQPKKMFSHINMHFNLDEAKKIKFQYEATYSKAIFMPMGTGFV